MDKIEYPITVNKIEFDEQDQLSWNDEAIGKFVSIRPIKDICPEMKTYLGLYLGELPVHPVAEYREDKTLVFHPGFGNPAIFVFDLNRIVMGYESWWGIIKSEEELKEITNEDIQNIWYVKVMKDLLEESGEPLPGE